MAAEGDAELNGLVGRVFAGVLFDLDGTLVDSSPGIHAAVRVAAAELGLPEPTADQLTAMVGPPLQDGFAAVLGVPVRTWVE